MSPILDRTIQQLIAHMYHSSKIQVLIVLEKTVTKFFNVNMQIREKMDKKEDFCSEP